MSDGSSYYIDFPEPVYTAGATGNAEYQHHDPAFRLHFADYIALRVSTLTWRRASAS